MTAALQTMTRSRDESTSPTPRRVFVLGRKAVLDVESVARGAADDGVPLVILILGLRITPRQEGIVWEALRLASVLPIWIDAVLVGPPREMAQFVQPTDDVTILATRRERRKVERALGRWT